MKPVLLILACALSLGGQQTVNGGRTTLGPIDNSGATHTLSFKVGTSNPATCTVGELLFRSDATAGQNIYECASTNTWTQQLNTGSSSGGGISVYSANNLTVTANTYYFPIGGGGSPSTTETNVDVDSPAAATITNFYAQISVALGMGNTGVFTLRKNASSQSVTCTISGASATSCNDTTHSFNVSQGDLLTVQLVTTGTIVVTPNVMFAMQFGNITASGTVNTGTAGQVTYYAANGSAVSGGSVTGAVKAGNPPTQAACADLSNAGTGCSATLAAVATSGSAADLTSGLLGNARYYGTLCSNWVATDESTTSTAYGDLATVDSCTFTLAATTNVAVLYMADEYISAGTVSTGPTCANIVNIGGSDVTASQALATMPSGALNEEVPGIAKYVNASLASGAQTVKVRHKVFSGSGTPNCHWLARMLVVEASP